MRTMATWITAAAVAVALLGPQAWAGDWTKWRGGRGWGPGGEYARMYDPGTVETARGEVVTVDEIEPLRGMSEGVHLTLRTDRETVPVHLGPEWYLEHQEAGIAPGDTIEVKGSRITFQGSPALIAREVTKGDQVLVLRDERGFPLWSGWRRR